MDYEAENCWNTLKTVKPQRNDEIRVIVMAAKAERINCMAYGEIKARSVLSALTMGNQQPRPEQGMVQRLCTAHLIEVKI